MLQQQGAATKFSRIIPVRIGHLAGSHPGAWLGLATAIVALGALGAPDATEPRAWAGGPYTINAAAGPNGSISPSGAVSMAARASQGFSIAPNAGYHVADVLVDGSPAGAVTSYEFRTIVANHSIKASFAPDEAPDEAPAGPAPGPAPADPGPAPIPDPAPAPAPDPALAPPPPPPATYTIAASAGPHGSISPSGAVTLGRGASQAFAVTADSGYHVASVMVDASSVGAVTAYTFGRVDADHTISAMFAADVDDGAIVVAAGNSPDRQDADYRCDGADDQVQIQAAINAAGTSGGRVLLLEGTFRTSGTIRVYQNLTLEGSGYGTLIYLEDNSNCSVISNAGGYNIARANVTIRNLRVDGNKGRQSAGHGILRTGANAICENLWVENCFSRGISQSSGDRSRIAGCTVRGCTGRGIFLEQSSDARIAGNSVHNCGMVFYTQEDKAVEVYGGADNKIVDNYIEGGGTMRQIGAWDSPRVEIRGNTLVGGLGMGIAPMAPHALIIDNTVANAGNNAIDTCGADDNRIEGNTISRVTSVPLGPANIENSGICVNGSRTVIINNCIELCGRAGVHIGPGNNDNQVLNNVIKGCGQQGFGQAGIWVQVWTANAVISGTVIRGNTIFDDQAVRTQEYGVWLDPGSGYIDDTVIEGNDLRGDGSAAVQMHPSSRVRNATVRDNLV